MHGANYGRGERREPFDASTPMYTGLTVRWRLGTPLVALYPRIRGADLISS